MQSHTCMVKDAQAKASVSPTYAIRMGLTLPHLLARSLINPAYVRGGITGGLTMGRRSRGVFTITPEQGGGGREGSPPLCLVMLSLLLDAIRDVINEGLVGSTGDHSSCGVGLKGSVSHYLLKILTPLHINRDPASERFQKRQTSPANATCGSEVFLWLV